MKPISIFNSQNRNQFDADAQAFFNVVTTLDSTQKSAYNTLVLGLKSDGIWAKTIALYPILGGTADNHKWNGKDLRDLNAAYRLIFTGVVTHSTSGMTGNGTTGYANTFLNPNSAFASGFGSLGVYLRTNIDGITSDIGAISNSTNYTQIYPRFNNVFYGQISSQNINQNVVNNDSRGWFFASRTASQVTFIQKNSTQTNFSGAGHPTGIVNNNIFLLAQCNIGGTPHLYSARQMAFAGVWTALTTTEGTNLYNRIQTYQTSLGRNV